MRPDLADDDYWPLAWCAACNEIVEAAGGIERAVMALPLTAVAAGLIPCLGEFRLENERGYNVFLVLGVEPIEPVEPSPAFFAGPP